MTTTPTTASLSQLRRRAAAAELRIWKPSERSRRLCEYGPFALIGVRTRAIVARNLDQVELGAEIDARLSD